jgi:hypothetical protein
MIWIHPLDVLGAEKPYILIVEPWASQYEIHPKDQCGVLIKHSSQPARIGVELNYGNVLTVWAQLSGSTYEFWRNGKQEDENSISVP